MSNETKNTLIVKFEFSDDERELLERSCAQRAISPGEFVSSCVFNTIQQIQADTAQSEVERISPEEMFRRLKLRNLSDWKCVSAELATGKLEFVKGTTDDLYVFFQPNGANEATLIHCDSEVQDMIEMADAARREWKKNLN